MSDERSRAMLARAYHDAFTSEAGRIVYADLQRRGHVRQVLLGTGSVDPHALLVATARHDFMIEVMAMVEQGRLGLELPTEALTGARESVHGG